LDEPYIARRTEQTKNNQYYCQFCASERSRGGKAKIGDYMTVELEEVVNLLTGCEMCMRREACEKLYELLCSDGKVSKKELQKVKDLISSDKLLTELRLCGSVNVEPELRP